MLIVVVGIGAVLVLSAVWSAVGGLVWFLFSQIRLSLLKLFDEVLALEVFS
jgi:hypothetical protein